MMWTRQAIGTVAALAAMAATPAASQPAAAACAQAPASPCGLRDRAELESFLDGLMLANMNDAHVAGATIAVVRDGALFFAKGYGYADVSARTPVDPERTMFKIGSVSKLFVWTSVMQLVQAGRLDLDVDVNRYLDFQIPATYAEPITLRHMLTHTTGFEEDNRDLVAASVEQAGAIGPWLARHVPGRVRPPGRYAAYSNYATALAAHIVERVTGQTWQEYEEQHIFRPLGMAHTTNRQAGAEAFESAMSSGYRFSAGHFERKPAEIFTGVAPAGTVAASAVDMATFMLAQLGDGAVGGRRILDAATVAMMHRRTFSHDPRLPGFALGFYEQSSHGLRIIGHGGNTRWFHSDLTLVPSEHLGVFVSYNTDTGHDLASGMFLREFLDHYYPVPPAPVAATSETVAQAPRVAGEYRIDRTSYTTFQRALGLSAPVDITANADGTLHLQASFADMHLVPIGPWLYRDELGTDRLAFTTNAAGEVTHGFIASLPVMMIERVPWYQSVHLHRAILLLSGLVFAFTIWAAIARLFRRRWDRLRGDDILPGRSLVVWAAAADLGFLAAAVLFVSIVSTDVSALTRSPLPLELSLALPVAAAVLAIAGVFVAVRQWRDRDGTALARLRYAAIVALTLLFTWSLSEWNLLGWKW